VADGTGCKPCAVLASMACPRNGRIRLQTLMGRLHVEPPPEHLLAAIRSVAKERLLAADLHGKELGQAVRRVSEAYRRERGTPADLRGDDRTLCARLKFFLPRDWPKVAAPLAELAAVGALPTAKALRVLDLGAGLGATGLGAAAFALARPGIEHVTIDAIDRDARALEIALALSQRFARTAGLALELRPHRAALNAELAACLSPPYQLIVLGFVLNELYEDEPDKALHHARWLSRLSELLTDDGAIVVLEPALRASSRTLQSTRGLLAAAAGPPYVFAPCLHRGACPLLERERDWCHEQLPLELPDEIAPVARAAGLRTSELTYSYLTLHRAPRSLAELDPSARLLRVVSAPLRSKGKLELSVCGAGAVRKLRRLERHASAGNHEIESANRGAILRLSPSETEETSVQRVTDHTRTEAVQLVAGPE
jgi:ribosomal protein RSM22 (predicted rRNA methylase)